MKVLSSAQYAKLPPERIRSTTWVGAHAYVLLDDGYVHVVQEEVSTPTNAELATQMAKLDELRKEWEAATK